MPGQTQGFGEKARGATRAVREGAGSGKQRLIGAGHDLLLLDQWKEEQLLGASFSEPRTGASLQHLKT